MRNEYSNTERQAVLLELSLNYNEEINKAMDKRDFEKAKVLIELKACVDKVMDDIAERG